MPAGSPSPGKARILIAGCGYVGTRLGEELAADGHPVFGLRREPHGLPPEIHPVAADLGEPAALAALPPAELVVYAASASGRSEESYRRAYVDGLRNLLGALDGRGVRRLVFVSSTGVYGQEGGEWVDETTPCEPRHFSGRILLEAEALALGAPFAAIVVRFGGIYGPARTRLVEAVRAGTATCTDDPPLWTNRIHRDDCAGVLRHLLALERPEPLYVGVDDEPASQCDVYRWIARRLGVPGPKVEAAAGETRYGRRSNKWCGNRRLRASGYAFRYPTFREGYGALIDAGA